MTAWHLDSSLGGRLFSPKEDYGAVRVLAGGVCGVGSGRTGGAPAGLGRLALQLARDGEGVLVASHVLRRNAGCAEDLPPAPKGLQHGGDFRKGFCPA